MDKEQQIEKIESWLLGTLPLDKAAAFQHQLDTDPELVKAVALHRIALQAGQHLADQVLKNNVLAWLPTAKEEKLVQLPESPASYWSRNKWLGLALALILMAASIIYYLAQELSTARKAKAQLATEQADWNHSQERSQSNLTKLVTVSVSDSLTRDSLLRADTSSKEQPKKTKAFRPMAYYQAPKDWGTLLRSDALRSDQSRLLQTGVEAFQSGKLNEAAAQARTALAEDPNQRDARRLLAHTLFVQGRYLEASHEFHWLLSVYPSKREEMEWNLLLCYRSLLDGAAAEQPYRTLLKQILANPKHQWYEQAQRL